MEKQKLISAVIVIGIFFFALTIYTKLLGPIPFSINSINTNKSDVFEASGTGKAAAAPDKAKVSVGITEQASQALDAQSKVNAKAKNIIDAIKSLGIPEKDIKTTNYSVNPDYSFNGTQRISGYTVTQNIEVKSDIDMINQVVDKSSAAGANITGGIEFTLSDDKVEKLENQAREEAVKIAKRKAESLAKAAGIRLGKIIDVNETNAGDLGRPVFLEAKAADQVTTSNPPDITPGENNIEITVTLIYQTL